MLGEGVTRNFLTLLEGDIHRSRRSLYQLLAVSAAVIAVAAASLHEALYVASGVVLLALVLAHGLGYIYARRFILESYEVSLRDHWNRWMRWSVTSRSVPECYARVHDRASRVPWWLAGVILGIVLFIHAAAALFALSGQWPLEAGLALLAADAVWVGFLLGRRWAERRWYESFLRSCNSLLRDGNLGLWGVL